MPRRETKGQPFKYKKNPIEPLKKKCKGCGKFFLATTPATKKTKIWCSDECRFNHAKAKTREKQIKQMKGDTQTLAKMARSKKLTPEQTANIRGYIARQMVRHIDNASRVIDGDLEWNATQARLFSSLINKVVPDLNASHVQMEHKQRKIEEMTREELEEIASGAAEIKETDLVAEYEDVTPQTAPTSPTPEEQPTESTTDDSTQRPETSS